MCQPSHISQLTWSGEPHSVIGMLVNEKQLLWFQSAIPQSYQKGDIIYHQGEPHKGLFYIQKGVVGIRHTTHSGREHLLRLYKCHSFFGHKALLTHEPYFANAFAMEPVQLLFLPKGQALELFEKNPLFYRELADLLAKDLARCEIQRVMILENQILARTAQAIVYLKEFFPNRHWTRQEIADFIASTSTTVIKALGELERRGLIEQSGRHIIIKDREGLLAIHEDEVF
ncbi:MAG: Crp/Fnr family transcriptional regulator [Bdellovibrionaceae bacterium]|nr:Crp/Fnr family transcriptional regulator [Pseudobdellovibrionaceae bacterium]MDW8190718.1 Crp/Fnr family transcriptional regulator [Pseudobdellovibrionaceae bacterium]